MTWSYPYSNILKRLIQAFRDCSQFPTTSGIISTFRIAHIVDISLLRSWYISILPLSFELTAQSAGTATSIILQTLSSFPTTTISGLPASIVSKSVAALYVEVPQHFDLISLQHTLGLMLIPFVYYYYYYYYGRANVWMPRVQTKKTLAGRQTVTSHSID